MGRCYGGGTGGSGPFWLRFCSKLEPKSKNKSLVSVTRKREFRSTRSALAILTQVHTILLPHAVANPLLMLIPTPNFRRVIHRDLKPENILMTGGVAKVSDFGLAGMTTPTNSKLQLSCGTPEFCAPEVLKGKPYGPSVDIWCSTFIPTLSPHTHPPGLPLLGDILLFPAQNSRECDKNFLRNAGPRLLMLACISSHPPPTPTHPPLPLPSTFSHSKNQTRVCHFGQTIATHHEGFNSRQRFVQGPHSRGE